MRPMSDLKGKAAVMLGGASGSWAVRADTQRFRSGETLLIHARPPVA